MERRAGLVLALLFVVSLPAVTPRIYASDEIQYFAYLRSLWFDRDVSFENEYRWFYDRGIAASPGFHETFLERTTETGRRINFGTIGSAILWAPFYGGGDIVARLQARRDPSVTTDGFSRPYVAAVAYGSAFYGMLALWLSILVARRLVGPALTPALAVLCGTPLRLLHVHRAADVARVLGVRRGALHVDVAARPRDVEPGLGRGAGPVGRPDGHGPRTGRVLRRRARPRLASHVRRRTRAARVARPCGR